MYDISDELKGAIESLFSNPDEGYLALGCTKLSGFESQAPSSELQDPRERVAAFRRKIEDWVELYGMEIEEFDSDYDSLRLSSEARAMLLVLREINNFFPEVNTAPKE